MTKNRRVAFYVPEEWWKGLSALAGTFGVSADEVIRQSLPDDAVIGLFFQCRVYEPNLQWTELADAGRAAIRERLRAAYMRGLQEHLARLDLGLDSSAEQVEAAKKRALDDLEADAARPLQEGTPNAIDRVWEPQQIARAREDSVYLGCLYDAWKRAKAGEPGYCLAEVDVVQGDSVRPRKTWAVLKDNQVV